MQEEQDAKDERRGYHVQILVPIGGRTLVMLVDSSYGMAEMSELVTNFWVVYLLWLAQGIIYCF
jgi:hypothetical protein